MQHFIYLSKRPLLFVDDGSSVDRNAHPEKLLKKRVKCLETSKQAPGPNSGPFDEFTEQFYFNLKP